MRSSYRLEDVILLLKDITGLVTPLPTKERERLIQSGKHYCEMLPIEYVPTPSYMKAYQEALKNYSVDTAKAVGNLSDKIIEKKGKDVVLVSLARAGIPIGILLKHYIQKKFSLKVPHYSISIIRGKGIDKNAMNFLLNHFQPEQLLFVDGWTGKGAILNELKKAMEHYQGVSSEIAVIADPANRTDLCGTHEDILIPSSCLNCTVSGLISRTFLREDLIGPDDFHGAIYYEELKHSDLSYPFIESIEKQFDFHKKTAETQTKPFVKTNEIKGSGIEEVKEIAKKFEIEDLNLIKPGIGETTRVLLRRVPWKILIDQTYQNHPQLNHLVQLAKEKKVPVLYTTLNHYKCCGIIKKLADT